MVLGENGLINKAQSSVDKYQESANNEQILLNSIEEYIELKGKEAITPYTQLVENIANIDELNRLFNTEGFTTEVLKIKECREFMYDNYAIFEPILTNSNIAQNEMRNSEQYEVVSRTGQYKNFYSGKAFVLGFSCKGGSRGNYDVDNFLSGNFKWDPSNYYSTTGLAYKVNKFASKININGVYGTSINWDNEMYVAFIKI